HGHFGTEGPVGSRNTDAKSLPVANLAFNGGNGRVPTREVFGVGQKTSYFFTGGLDIDLDAACKRKRALSLRGARLLHTSTLLRLAPTLRRVLVAASDATRTQRAFMRAFQLLLQSLSFGCHLYCGRM